jgi:oligopeptide transport system substrate-binding protein
MSKILKTFAVLALSLFIALVSLPGQADLTAAAAAEKVLRSNFVSDPVTIDPSLTTEISSAQVILNCFEGLMGYDAAGKLVTAAAESYTVSKDGLTYTFKLRKDGTWSNGDPVKASDFVFAWTRVLSPETAAEYAVEMYYIKNGEKFNKGEAKAADLGIKAIDDYTLEVKLENPTGFFLALTTSFFYMPENEKVVSANKEWTLKGETYVGNGPFKLQEWRPKDRIIIVKNPKYRDAAQIKLDKIEFRILTDANSTLATYEAGDLDVADSNIPAAMVPSLLAEGKAKNVPYLGSVWMHFNVSDNAATYDPVQAKATLDPRVRKALALAIDRNVLVKNVTKSGERPATSLVPYGIIGSDGKDYKDKEYFKPEGDVAEAKRLLAEAGYPDGKGFPALTYIYGNFGVNGDVAQAVQAMLKKNLNVTLNLEDMEYGVMLNRRNKKNRQYIMAYHRWIADYVDPSNFLTIFTFADSNNYNNPKFDALLKEAQTIIDPVKRFDKLREAEAVLMGDMPLIPLYYMTNTIMVQDYVKGYSKDVMGYVRFRYVDIVK